MIHSWLWSMFDIIPSGLLAGSISQTFINHGQPWFNHGLWNGTSANHGWPCSDQAFYDHGQPWFVKWHLSQPWLTVLWTSFLRPWSTMVQPWFVKWHLSQPWLTMLWSSFLWPWSTMVCEMAPQSTMVDHALTKLSLTMVKHALAKLLNHALTKL